MDKAFEIFERGIHEGTPNASHKRPIACERNEKYEDLLNIALRKAWQDDIRSASRSRMTLRAAYLERAHDIAYEIILNTYPHEVGAVRI